MLNSLQSYSRKILFFNKSILITTIVSIIAASTIVFLLLSFLFNVSESLNSDFEKNYGSSDIILTQDINKTEENIKNVLEQDVNISNYINEISSLYQTNEKLNEKMSNQTVDLYIVGVENTNVVKSRYKNQNDLSGNEIILDFETAKYLEKKVGDNLHIRDVEFEIVETIDFPQISSDRVSIAMISVEDFELLQFPRQLVYTLIDLYESNTVDDISSLISEKFPDVEVNSIRDDADINSEYTLLFQFVLILVFFVVVMIGFVLSTNFYSFLITSKNQFSVLRAIGAVQKDIMGILMYQSWLMVFAGEFIGILLAFLFFSILATPIGTLLNLQSTNIAFPYIHIIFAAVCFFIVINTFFFISISRFTKLLPKQIDSNEKPVVPYGSISKKISVFISSLALIGMGIVYLVIYDNKPIGIYGVIVIFLLVLSFITINPYISIVMEKISRLAKKRGAGITFVAIKDLQTHARKSNLLIMSFCLSIAITIFGSSVMRAVKLNSDSIISHDYLSNYYVSSRTAYSNSFDEEFYSKLRKIGEEETVIISYDKIRSVGNESYTYIYADIENLVANNILVNSSIDPFNEIVISSSMAQLLNLRIGDVFTCTNDILFSYDQNGNVVDQTTINESFLLKVGAIADFEGFFEQNDFIIDWKNSSLKTDDKFFMQAYIFSEKSDYVSEQLSDLQNIYPEMQWNTLEEALKINERMFMQRYSFFYSTASIVLFCILITIFNSLFDYILSNKKNYAVLRVLKLKKKELFLVILIPVLYFILRGILFGAILGMFSTHVMVYSDQLKISSDQFDFNFIAVIVISLIVASFSFVCFLTEILSKNRLVKELKYDEL